MGPGNAKNKRSISAEKGRKSKKEELIPTTIQSVREEDSDEEDSIQANSNA